MKVRQHTDGTWWIDFQESFDNIYYTRDEAVEAAKLYLEEMIAQHFKFNKNTI